MTLNEWITEASARLHTALSPDTPSWSPEIARSEIKALAAATLERTPAQLCLTACNPLTAEELDRLNHWLNQRKFGVPLAYLTGRVNFWSLELDVSRETLVPRADSEVLVERALLRLPTGGRFLDLGTGSGAIACALGHERPDTTGIATDIWWPSARVAQQNCRRHAPNVNVIVSDWLEAFCSKLADSESHLFDLIVGNPPYLTNDDPHLNGDSLKHEPRIALVSGQDGLAAIRRITDDAPAQIRHGGWLLLEHGSTQGADIRELFRARGFSEISTYQDLSGLDRVTEARWYR
ncbi:MAG: peptide chain release factor N(5)-glutamine methyltransferase [Thioalkalivibrionaceae bacterium]